jgi:hypothetical protein
MLVQWFGQLCGEEWKRIVAYRTSFILTGSGETGNLLQCQSVVGVGVVGELLMFV